MCVCVEGNTRQRIIDLIHEVKVELYNFIFVGCISSELGFRFPEDEVYKLI